MGSEMIPTFTFFAVIAVSVLRRLIQEGGIFLRQKSALETLERLAESHPDAATLVQGIVKATTPAAPRR